MHQGKVIGKALTKALDHDDEVIQVRAMEALADRGELSVIRKLQKLFTSESQLVAREALVNLDLLEPDREGWEKTLLKLARSKVYGVRMGAANALVRVPGMESAQAIHQLFEDAQWTVRMEAYEAARGRNSALAGGSTRVGNRAAAGRLDSNLE